MQTGFLENHGGGLVVQNCVAQPPATAAATFMPWWTSKIFAHPQNNDSSCELKSFFPGQIAGDDPSSSMVLPLQCFENLGSAHLNTEKAASNSNTHKTVMILDFASGDEKDLVKESKYQSYYPDTTLNSPVTESQPSFELGLGQPMVHTNYSHADPCHALFGGHGAQVLHGRVMLPMHMTEDVPVYVNAKQFRGIIRRRLSRAKAAMENKITKAWKPYLHESRHLHAMRRVRGCGGRFLNVKKSDSAKDGRNAETRSEMSPSFDTPLSDGGRSKSAEVHFGLNPCGSEVTSMYSHSDGNNCQLAHFRSAFHSPGNMDDSAKHSVIPYNWITVADGCCDLLKI